MTDNLSRLIQDGKHVRLRIPLIPGFNTDPESLSALAETAALHGAQKVDLLPFHRLGSGKYKALGWAYRYADTPPLSVQEATRMGDAFRARGLHVRVEH